jgi:hypothetical protein
VFKSFLPTENERPKDAIAWLDVLMEARTEPDGYKEIIKGGDDSSCFSLQWRLEVKNCQILYAKCDILKHQCCKRISH